MPGNRRAVPARHGFAVAELPTCIVKGTFSSSAVSHNGSHSARWYGRSWSASGSSAGRNPMRGGAFEFLHRSGHVSVGEHEARRDAIEVATPILREPIVDDPAVGDVDIDRSAGVEGVNTRDEHRALDAVALEVRELLGWVEAGRGLRAHVVHRGSASEIGSSAIFTPAASTSIIIAAITADRGWIRKVPSATVEPGEVFAVRLRELFDERVRRRNVTVRRDQATFHEIPPGSVAALPRTPVTMLPCPQNRRRSVAEMGIDMPEVVETTARRRPRRRGERGRCVQGHPVRRRHRRRRALSPTATAAPMGRSPRLRRVRAVVPADRGRRDDRPGAAGRDRDHDGRLEPRAPDGRGLPRAQRVDAAAG